MCIAATASVVGHGLARQLAESLRQVRQAAGMSQTEMAKRLGLSQPTVNWLESVSQNTTLESLGQLCRALTRKILTTSFEPV
jgi:transcriptional regulator with XRE-family HTH domain